MIKNIIIYLLLLISVFTFNIFYFAWFSWFLLVVTVAVPIVSLAVSLPFMITSALNGISVFANKEAKVGNDFFLIVSGRKGRAAFCPLLRINIRVENRFSNYRQKAVISYAGSLTKPFFSRRNDFAKHCGCVKIDVGYAKIYDFTGIFFIPVRIKTTVTCDVLPKPKKPAILPNTDIAFVVGSKPKSGGLSDFYELREYRAGDSLKNIHWKLSSKYDDLIVKEPCEPIYKTSYVEMLFCDKPDVNDDILARFMYACNYLIKKGSPCCVCTDECQISVISDSGECVEFIKAFYREQPYNTRLAEDSMALIYSIFENGEEVDVIEK